MRMGRRHWDWLVCAEWEELSLGTVRLGSWVGQLCLVVPGTPSFSGVQGGLGWGAHPPRSVQE